MTTRYVVLSANTEKTITYSRGYDQCAVFHTANVDGDVYADTTGATAAVPTDTTGAVDHTVKFITKGARRVLTVERATPGAKRRTLSLIATGNVRLELEFS